MKTGYLTRSGLRWRFLLIAVVLSTSGWAADFTPQTVNDIANSLGIPPSSVFIKSSSVVATGGSSSTTTINGNYKLDTSFMDAVLATLVMPMQDVPVSVTNNKTAAIMIKVSLKYSAYVMVGGVKQDPVLTGKFPASSTTRLQFKINSLAWRFPVDLVIIAEPENYLYGSRMTIQRALPPSGISMTIP